MGVGILLVHGYTGLNMDLEGLDDQLSSKFGRDHVCNLELPFIGDGPVSRFDAHVFEAAVAAAAAGLKRKYGRLAVFGHSTGGTLILSCLSNGTVHPDLLILAGVPRRVDKEYIKQWETYCPEEKAPGFTDVCKMISLINSVGKREYENDFPVILMNGQSDYLVLPETGFEWQKNFKGNQRTIILPHADHHFPSDDSFTDWIADFVAGAIRDIQVNNKKSEKNINVLKSVEPEIAAFLKQSPFSEGHLVQCPSGRRLVEDKDYFPPTVNWDPVFANIEITTRCNLACRFCMRTRMGISGKDMTFETFSRIIERIPHAYRITFVGLGEPLLHPDIIRFVNLVKAYGKRAALVTNGQTLDREIAGELIRAGLDSIIFSIDTPNQASADKLRPGTDLHRVISNIKAFTAIEKASGREMSKAVFSALSLLSINDLIPLVDLIAELGVDVLMVSDLNFHHNFGWALLNNIDDSGKKKIRDALKHSFARQMPVLSVHGLEEFGLRKRYQNFLALPPSKIYTRPREHTHCVSLWQTLPVNVDGDVYLCDCRPDKIAGNLIESPFEGIWNGELFRNHRLGMRKKMAPEICRICPRF
jgi:MoaA/NifB/PqqE/SkfB family radical SAM enzyme